MKHFQDFLGERSSFILEILVIFEETFFWFFVKLFLNGQTEKR